jgi:enolase
MDIAKFLISMLHEEWVMMQKDHALSVTKTKSTLNPNIYLGISLAIALIGNIFYHIAISSLFA